MLAEAGVIPDSLAGSLVAMTRFRNILAHGYVGIDFEKVYDTLHHSLGDIRSFLSTLVAKLAELGVELEEL